MSEKTTYLDTPCRICQVNIRLKCEQHIIDAVPAIGTLMQSIREYKLRLSCNRCGELSERRAKIEAWIRRSCESLVLPHSDKERADLKELIYAGARKYADVMAEIRKLDTAVFDNRFPEDLCDHPKEWATILAQYRKICVPPTVPA